VFVLGSLEEAQIKVSLEDLLNADKQGMYVCTCVHVHTMKGCVYMCARVYKQGVYVLVCMRRLMGTLTLLSSPFPLLPRNY